MFKPTIVSVSSIDEVFIFCETIKGFVIWYSSHNGSHFSYVTFFVFLTNVIVSKNVSIFYIKLLINITQSLTLL